MVNIKLYSFTFIPQKIFSYLLLIQVIFTADEVFLYGSYEKIKEKEILIFSVYVFINTWCAYVTCVGTHVTVHVWRSEENFAEPVFSSHLYKISGD